MTFSVGATYAELCQYLNITISKHMLEHLRLVLLSSVPDHCWDLFSLPCVLDATATSGFITPDIS